MENLEIATKYEKVVRLINNAQGADNLKAAFDDYTNSLDFGDTRRVEAALKYCAGLPIETLESGYFKTELDCKACPGPCGRCQEIKIETLEAENAALRAAVAEMQRMLPVIDKIELHDFYWEWATEHTGIATANAYRAHLQAALDKINKTGQNT